jgi:hypothetical protein
VSSLRPHAKVLREGAIQSLWEAILAPDKS